MPHNRKQPVSEVSSRSKCSALTGISDAAEFDEHKWHGSRSSLSFCPSLAAVARRDQLYSSFLACHLPESQYNTVEHQPWFALLPYLPAKTAALEASMMAICTAKLGRKYGDRSLIRESHELYHEGLIELQKALWHPALMLHDGTLGASMALAMYEVIENPTETRFGYLSHADGLAKLVHLRGPMAHRDGLAHWIFQGFRFMEVCVLQSFCSSEV